MKNKSYSFIRLGSLSLFLGTFLVGCTNSLYTQSSGPTPTVDYVEGLDVYDAEHGDPFLTQLAMNYRSYAIYNARVSGYADLGEMFAQKAIAAYNGELPYPESTEYWTIGNTDDAVDIGYAYNGLIESFTPDAVANNPEVAAEAQAKYDCWISAYASGQMDTANECRDRFFSAMEALGCENILKNSDGSYKKQTTTMTQATNTTMTRSAGSSSNGYYPETRNMTNTLSSKTAAREGIVIVNNIELPANLLNQTQTQPMVVTTATPRYSAPKRTTEIELVKEDPAKIETQTIVIERTPQEQLDYVTEEDFAQLMVLMQDQGIDDTLTRDEFLNLMAQMKDQNAADLLTRAEFYAFMEQLQFQGMTDLLTRPDFINLMAEYNANGLGQLSDMISGLKVSGLEDLLTRADFIELMSSFQAQGLSELSDLISQLKVSGLENLLTRDEFLYTLYEFRASGMKDIASLINQLKADNLELLLTRSEFLEVMREFQASGMDELAYMINQLRSDNMEYLLGRQEFLDVMTRFQADGMKQMASMIEQLKADGLETLLSRADFIDMMGQLKSDGMKDLTAMIEQLKADGMENLLTRSDFVDLMGQLKADGMQDLMAMLEQLKNQGEADQLLIREEFVTLMAQLESEGMADLLTRDDFIEMMKELKADEMEYLLTRSDFIDIMNQIRSESTGSLLTREELDVIMAQMDSRSKQLDGMVTRAEFMEMMTILRDDLAQINERFNKLEAGQSSGSTVERTTIKVQQMPLEPKQKVMEEIFEIKFDFDKYTIKPEYKELIEKLAKTTQNNKNVKVSIVGHTDTAGSNKYNYALGGQRAEAVEKMLVKYGIPASQIVIVSAGENELSVKTPNNTPNAANRRVQVVKEVHYTENPKPIEVQEEITTKTSVSSKTQYGTLE